MPSITDAKVAYAERMNRLLDTYSKILFCDIDNVKSQQMHQVRAALRASGNEMLVGKKTLQKKIVALRAESDSATDADRALKAKLCDDRMLVGNLALVLTNDDVASVQKILGKYRVQAPARVGAIAPCEVTIPAGNTGMEPTMTNFFQALNIPTKISKGTVEIISDRKVLSPGDKVDASTAQLLVKLKISPFFYQAEVRFFFERGLMFTADDLCVTDEVIETALLGGIGNITALSLGTGLITDLSFPHAIMDGFKDLLGAAVAADYSFSEFNGAQLIEDIKSGKAVGGGGGGAAAPAAAAGGAAPAAKKEKTPEASEEDDDMGMGLFD